MTILFAVDTLEYLRRGGRIGAAQAFLGSALKIKPILSIDSEITPVERVRTQGRAIDRLVRELSEQREAGADVYFIQHVQAPELAERIGERGREIYGRDPEFVSAIGPVIGTHTGPGLVGVDGAAHRSCSAPSSAGRTPRPRCEPPGGERARRVAPTPTPSLSTRAHRPHRPDGDRVRADAVPDLPAAQAADLDLHRRLHRDRAVRARSTSCGAG